ncbi:phage holin [Staphylococcus gallinarum]|uniref:phage holin n=1 Tax=Staphylococcus gallinarum TaxID=1293 RepID=UPI001E3A10E4|nr:phage holin [Staphylococcus gallinarum]MEB6054443.1 phage holin [Staphylococcus gallinarum]MEB6277483.1 phage holin [Staphylococcus gallinarum]MEB7040168.1 phage holin [Staphylococcus gallinarum]UEH02108.1 phage holin [Staphylococcus gallinarum]
MTIGAAARFIVLILALINQWLATKNISPIPVDEDGISSILLTIVALYTAYKDNPVTKEGHQANIEMKQKKLDKKQGANGKAPIDIQDNEGQI